MIRRLILTVLLMTALVSCREEKNNIAGLNIKDDLGKDFYFDKIPEKVVSLAPSLTEMAFYIGAGDKLAGVTKYCDYPPEAKNKKIVGGLLDPNLELIAGIKPDLILLTTEGNSKQTYNSLTDLGYRVFVLNPRKIRDITAALDKLNLIFKTRAGNEQINKFRSGVENLAVSGDSLRSYAAFLSVKPFVSFNDSTFIGDIFRSTGFKNVFGSEKLDYPGIYDEDLLLKNPECLFFFSDSSSVSVENIKSEISLRFSELKACRNGKFYILNESIFSRPGPRVLEAMAILNQIRKKQ